MFLSSRDIGNSEEEDQIPVLYTEQQLKKIRLSQEKRFLTKTLICLIHQTEGFVSYSALWQIWFVAIPPSSLLPAIYIPFHIPNSYYNFLFVCFVVVEAVSPCRVQAGLKHCVFQIGFNLSIILLSLPPESWNFNYESPHLSTNNIVKLPCKGQYFLIPGR